MLLSKIKAKPELYQFRDAPFSEKTVAGIVKDGINLAKFDPIPLIGSTDKDGRYTVAGDGHSRLEAIIRLAGENRLPAQWKKGRDWEITTRFVNDAEAQILAWTANISRDSFRPCEEAKVFQAMLDAGKNIEDVAAMSHKSTGYIRKMLPLNSLARDIRLMVGADPDAGGIEKHIAQVLAAKFQQYGIDATQQQQLWHRVLKHADLTATFAAEFIDRIGRQMTDRQTDGVLFAIPANVEEVMRDMADRAQQLRRAARGLAWLMQCKDSGVLDDELADLKALLDRSGRRMLDVVKAKTRCDADLISALCYNQ